MYTYDENLFSDLHKDAYGVRPTSYARVEWSEATPTQKQVLWDELLGALESNMAGEKARQESAVASFESKIEALIALGAGTRNTAIRWFIDSLNLSEMDKVYGGSYVCYDLGLPYSMEAIFEPFLKINA